MKLRYHPENIVTEIAIQKPRNPNCYPPILSIERPHERAGSAAKLLQLTNNFMGILFEVG